MMYEILDRPLNVGDFVLEMTDYAGKHSYGLVISDGELYKSGGIEKVSKVYKIEFPVEKEVGIYKSLVSDYQEFVSKSLQKDMNKEDYHIGDIVYRYKGMFSDFYLYIGLANVGVKYPNNYLIQKSGYCYLFLCKYPNGYEDKLDSNISLMTNNMDISYILQKNRFSNDWTGRGGAILVIAKKSMNFEFYSKGCDVLLNERVKRKDGIMIDLEVLHKE